MSPSELEHFGPLEVDHPPGTQAILEVDVGGPDMRLVDCEGVVPICARELRSLECPFADMPEE